MHINNRAQGWGQSPEPSFAFEDGYDGTHGIDQVFASGFDFLPNGTLSDESNQCIDPAILGIPSSGNSLSDEYAYGDFESIQDDSETNSTL
ncbi:hypothetical protein PG996_008802 [Apiospora saccharicola]|uniref:Uncharacterized protein n=1 Tax=Apiospora saccharicola TaxID=335842 RepID=A0ABR1UZ18_9PEZI